MPVKGLICDGVCVREDRQDRWLVESNLMTHSTLVDVVTDLAAVLIAQQALILLDHCQLLLTP